MRVLLTGASGFVGAALVKALADAGYAVRAAQRRSRQSFPTVETVVVGELSADCDWRNALGDVAAVVHLAGPAHARFSQAELHKGIVEGTARLAAQAQEAGVKRFLYVSSIKAVAARSRAPIGERSAPAPQDAYGRAKLEAERAVMAHDTLVPVVLRPPLVHAGDAKANFAMLMALATSPLPLPLAGIANRRSTISREALVGAILAVLRASQGPAGVFHVAEQPALSSAEIVTALRAGLGREANLMPALLPSLLPAALRESLEVDDASFRAVYGYSGADADSRAALAASAVAWKASR
jgi:UDP-glucose 4-epimerase